MSRHVQFRLDVPTARELDAFIAENPDLDLSQGEAIRMLVRTALGQPAARARAHELMAFTASMHVRVLDYVANQLKELNISYEKPVTPVDSSDPDVAESGSD